MYVSQDPIRLNGGITNIYAYVDDVNFVLDLFGLSSSSYADRYYAANPKKKKFVGKFKMEIHHRIPQMYIGKGKLFPEAMRTSLSNLQGLSKKVHRKIVSPLWTTFRKENPNPTRAKVMEYAMYVDKYIAKYIERIN